MNGVAPEKYEKEHSHIEKVAMHILQDEGKCRFTAIGLAALANCACGWIRKECTIVGFAVVVAGRAESQRAGKDQ